MTAITQPPGAVAAPPVRFRDAVRDNGLATVAMLLVVAVAAAGWSASFISLHDFAMTHMGFRTSKPAWLVPATFDGAAVGLSLLAFRAAIYGRASLGSLLYVDGFTALSSWINWVHIDDHAGGKFVSALLPIAAVLVFGKVLKEAREAYERRHGKAVFKVRAGLLVLRWLVDRAGTRRSIREQILAIPVEALIGLGAGDLARRATEHLAEPAAPAPIEAAPTADVEETVKALPDIGHVIAINTGGVDRVDPPILARADARPSTEEAERLILIGWMKGTGVRATARVAGREPSQVSRTFARLDKEFGRSTRADRTSFPLPLAAYVNGHDQPRTGAA
jgi:hypothetical protein